MDLDEFNQKIRSYPLPVVVDVWAPWCGPCRMIGPALQKLGMEYTGRVEVWKINADQNPSLVRALGIYGIPTLLVFRGGKEILRTTGAQPQSSLARLFEAALGAEPAGKTGLSLAERLFRGGAGLVLLAAAWFLSLSPLLYLLGGAILFSSVYDRCPVWQAISPRLSRLINRWVLKNP